MSGGSLFGALFIGHSFPIADCGFVRVDATHWVCVISSFALVLKVFFANDSSVAMTVSWVHASLVGKKEGLTHVASQRTCALARGSLCSL